MKNAGEEAPRIPLVILGATGVGKSQVAIQLAERLPVEIINADAMQVYRGFRIGTAQPTPQVRAAVRHHLFDFVEWPRVYSAGEFGQDINRVVQEVQARRHLPCIVGGTGLYLKSFLFGLHPALSSSQKLRQWIREVELREGRDALRNWLRKVDPQSAREIAASDMVRIRRALEIYCLTGRNRSQHLREGSFQSPQRNCVTVGLMLERQELYRRVNERVVQMIENGWIEEVESLLAQGIPANAHAMKAIGYRQLADWIQQRRKDPALLPDIIAEIQKETRRFVKRQATWFRKMAPEVWLDRGRLGDRTAREVYKVYQTRMAFRLNHWYHDVSLGKGTEPDRGI